MTSIKTLNSHFQIESH